jgi:hypothetical protein
MTPGFYDKFKQKSWKMMKDEYSYLTILYEDKNAVSLQPESET